MVGSGGKGKKLRRFFVFLRLGRLSSQLQTKRLSTFRRKVIHILVTTGCIAIGLGKTEVVFICRGGCQKQKLSVNGNMLEYTVYVKLLRYCEIKGNLLTGTPTKKGEKYGGCIRPLPALQHRFNSRTEISKENPGFPLIS